MDYYRRGSIEVWDFIRDQDLNFHLGNAVKYISRAGYKGGPLKRCEDLRKAIHYLQNELHHEENILIATGEGIPIQIRDQELSYQRTAYLSEESDRRGI
tara:strand:- start:92 stop:388 length:297 start_codon:yes stop_codon:yes gene_type:complete